MGLWEEFEFLEDAEGNPDSNNLLDWCKTHGDRGQLLIREWNHEKNINEYGREMDLIDYTYAVGKKVWWHCSFCGNDYQMSIASRTHGGQSCPACAHKRGGIKNHQNSLKNGNDLLSWSKSHGSWGQLLIDEWDSEKNMAELNISMSDVSYGVGKKVYWKCHCCGASFTASVIHRTLYKVGCTRCTSRGTSYPEQFLYYALKSIYPDTMNRAKLFENKEYDICIPELKICIEYDGYIWHRDHLDKDAKKADICRENGYQFFRVVAFDKGQELCVKDNEIRYAVNLEKQDEQLMEITKIILRFIGKSDIDIDFEAVKDEAYKTMKGERKDNFTTEYGELLDEWDFDNNRGINPKHFTAGSSMRVHWKCARCGHRWDNTINSRCRFRSGCPHCGYNVFDGKIHKIVAKRRMTCRFGAISL